MSYQQLSADERFRIYELHQIHQQGPNAIARALGRLARTLSRELGIDQPKISALINGKLAGFSTTRLFRFLNALGRDVEIVVKPKSHAQAQTRVVAS